MERNVKRIDGVITHLHRLTDEELDTERGHALNRRQRATDDIELLEAEIATRRDLGQIMLTSPVILEVTAVSQQAFEQRLGGVQ